MFEAALKALSQLLSPPFRAVLLKSAGLAVAVLAVLFIALGSGDPSRLICSALIADAFTAVRYPILPKITVARSVQALEQILEIRHSSLYCPRDFDISPYFQVVKPTLVKGFNYKKMHWADLPLQPTETDDQTPEVAAEEVTLIPASDQPIRLKRQRVSRRPQVH